jgi:ribosomal-protein-alanine N-acetyltransferase
MRRTVKLIGGSPRASQVPASVESVLSLPLVGPRVELRPFTLRDAPAMLAVYGDPQVMRWVGHGAVSTLPEVEAMLRQYITHQDRYGFAFWAVVERTTGRVIGDTGLARTADGKVEMGYTLARDHWGKGLATESAGLALQAAQETLAVPVVRALVEPENMASRHVLEKLGLRQVGEVTAFGRPHLSYERRR